MRPRISVGLGRFGVLASVFLCTLVVACTGDDEIYAVPKDAGPAGDATTASSSGGSSSGAASSSSGGTGNPDGSVTTDASTDGATDGGNDGSTSADGGNDSGAVDSGVDSGPVVCTLVACAANITCTNLGCGNCNLGQGFCKP